MEWTSDELRDLRWTEEALGRLRESLYKRGKWWWMWRVEDVQRELARLTDEARKGIYGTPIGEALAASNVAQPVAGHPVPEQSYEREAV